MSSSVIHMNHLYLSPDAGSSVLNSIGVISSDFESPGSILCPFTSWAGWEVDVADDTMVTECLGMMTAQQLQLLRDREVSQSVPS